MKMLNNKRAEGPLDLLVGAIIIVLIAIITVSVGISVLDPITTSLKGDLTTVTNESVSGGFNNATYTGLDNLDLGSVTGVAVNSTTAFIPILAGNYSVDTVSGGIILVFDGVTSYEGNASYVNYTYYIHGAAYNASSDGSTGLEAFADYWVSIVSIIILVVIVGLFAYFRGGVSGGGIEVR